MSEVLRNEQNEIIDTDGHPLELSASYKNVEVQRSAERAVVAKGVADAALKESITAPESYAAVFAKKAAEDALDAAKWRSFEHYRDNAAGYQEAAYEEDAQRTAAKQESDPADKPAGEVKN